MAAPVVLCLAPKPNGGLCQMKQRPCHHHIAYWAQASASAALQSSDEEGGEGEDDDEEEEDEEGDEEEEDDASDSDGAVKELEDALINASIGGGGGSSVPFLATIDARVTAEYLLEHFLSRPYTPRLKEACPIDWSYRCSTGEVVQRPNHGLAHTARVASLVPVALRMLVEVALAKGDPKQKQQACSVTERDVRKAQYVMLFSVIGRKNEISFTDATQLQKKQKAQGLANAPHLYDDFKRTAQRALRLLLQKQPPASLGFTEAEIDEWTHALDVGKPNPTSILTRAMALAHDVDLMRCYGKEQFALKVKDIEEAISVQLANELCGYARALVAATGDRCLGYGIVAKGYSDKLFLACSTNFRTCMERIHAVKAPSCMDQVTLPVTPLTSPTKKKPSSSSSGSGDGAMSPSSALAAKYDAKKESDPTLILMKELASLKLNASDDLSKYDQLKFQHSKVIKMFASTSSCWGCFLAKYSLSPDVIMNMYTRPDFFHTLNQALCQQINNPIVKMYAQVLSHALQEMEHESADLVVYRGVGYSDELLELYFDNIGEVVYLYNFTSTSRSRSVAAGFAKKQGARAAVMTIRVPKAMNAFVGDVAAKSNYPHEQELLIACNVGYRIDSVDLEARAVELSVADTSRCLSKTRKLCTEHKNLSTSFKDG